MKIHLLILTLLCLILVLVGCYEPIPPIEPTETTVLPTETPVSPLPTPISPLPTPPGDELTAALPRIDPMKGDNGQMETIFQVGEGVIQLLALLAALAFIIEAVVEIAFASWLGRVIQEATLRATILKLLGSGLGVVLALVYGIDLLGAVAQIFGVVATYPIAAAIVGRVLTGLLFGRGSQWFHDIGVTWLGLDGTAPSSRLV